MSPIIHLQYGDAEPRLLRQLKLRGGGGRDGNLGGARRALTTR